MQPLALPSPALHPIKADFGDGSNDAPITFCYRDANIETVDQCGERFKATCTGANGGGVCCSALGKCGSDCGAGFQEEFSNGKNLCEEGEAPDGFEAPQQQQAAAPEEPEPEFDPVKNAEALKNLMDAACDFDAQGCNKAGVCQACYIHFENCRGACAAAALPPWNRTRPRHKSRRTWPPPSFLTLGTFSRPHRTAGPQFEADGVTIKEVDKEAVLDKCMEQVSKEVPECGSKGSKGPCDTDDSKEAYKVRTGEHDPPGTLAPPEQVAEPISNVDPVKVLKSEPHRS